MNGGSPGRRPGRPRVEPRIGPRSGLEPREEILDVCASLFTQRGFAATSTRDIADAVGIRQASIYFHFPSGKEEILADLLQRSIRPTLERVEKIEALGAETGAGPEVLLYLLTVLDVRALATLPHNSGILARLPEAQGTDGYSPVGAAREDLGAAYARLGAQIGSTTGTALDAHVLGDLLLELVEIVIGMRSRGHQITPRLETLIGMVSLWVCEAGQTSIDRAAAEAAELISALE